MAFEIKPYPEFSWSQSRDATFKECARKYYFHYYAAHNGWLQQADDRTRWAYRLKQLSNLHLVFGTVIHEMAHQVIADVHRQQPTESAETWMKTVRNRLNRAYLDSKERERWLQAPKKTTMLHEMFYEAALPAKTVEQIKAKIEPCVRHFFASATFEEISADRTVVLVEAEAMKTTPFENDVMYVIPDLVYRRQDGTMVIVDWKTGKEYSQNEDQTLLYALYAAEQYRVPIEQIEIRLEYLNAGSHKRIVPSDADMESIRQWVRESLEQMKSLLENVAQNKPFPETFFAAAPAPMKCKSCPFREICSEKV